MQMFGEIPFIKPFICCLIVVLWLDKGISPKMCILCIRVKINKRSFEPFCIWILIYLFLLALGLLFCLSAVFFFSFCPCELWKACFSLLICFKTNFQAIVLIMYVF